jgi:hypothetical protein
VIFLTFGQRGSAAPFEAFNAENHCSSGRFALDSSDAIDGAVSFNARLTEVLLPSGCGDGCDRLSTAAASGAAAALIARHHGRKGVRLPGPEQVRPNAGCARAACMTAPLNRPAASPPTLPVMLGLIRGPAARRCQCVLREVPGVR